MCSCSADHLVANESIAVLSFELFDSENQLVKRNTKTQTPIFFVITAFLLFYIIYLFIKATLFALKCNSFTFNRMLLGSAAFLKITMSSVSRP